jgi:sortase A
MRRAVRWAGTLLIVAGVGLLAWCLVVWLWQDPFTGLYTRYEQRQLARSYDKLEASYRPLRPPRTSPPTPASLAAERRQIAREARRYRAQSERGDAIGRIAIPRLGLNMVVINGTDTASLKRGPARDLRTYMPGQGELVYIAGHRTTYLAPFSHIDSLEAGDRVTLRFPYATFVYRVTRHVVVPADDIGRLKSHGREVLALQACHPRFFATHRYIVYARPVQVTPRGGATYTLARSLTAGSTAPSSSQPSLR